MVPTGFCRKSPGPDPHTRNALPTVVRRGNSWVDSCRLPRSDSVGTDERDHTMSHPLDEKHRNELHASGISDAMIQAAQIHTVADGEIKRLLGWSLKDAQWGRGFAIPFPLAGSPEAVYCRVKLDNPRKLRGKEVKYESPKGSEPRAYFPPGTEAIVNDPAVPLWFTEGEKKRLLGDSTVFLRLAWLASGDLRGPASETRRGWGPDLDGCSRS